MSNSVSRRGFVAGAAGAGAMAVLAGLTACGSSKKDDTKKDAGDDSKATTKAKLEMVTDTGGVNDQSFNQLAWEGMQQLQKEEGWDVSYLESKQESDYATNLDKAVDDKSQLVWGVGFAMADAIVEAAKKNSDVQFAIIDNGNDDSSISNLTGVTFRAQEPSFLVGYIAARTTKTGKVGFVGGISSAIIDQFEYGYRAGVLFANKEQSLNVEIQSQYADSFTDAAKGKSIAAKMFSDGCDVVFHAAGGVGTGVIEAAKDAGKFAIGVDKDQAYLAPENVLTSALKKVNVAVVDVSKKILKDGDKGGKTVELGFTDDAVGIPEDHKLMGDEVYKGAMEAADKIKAGSIVPPANKDDLAKYEKSLA